MESLEMQFTFSAHFKESCFEVDVSQRLVRSAETSATSNFEAWSCCANVISHRPQSSKPRTLVNIKSPVSK